MGDLEQDAHAVAGLALGVLAGPVLQLLHDLQGVVHRGVAPAAPDVHHGADAAGVVLKPWVVQTPGGPCRFRKLFLHSCILSLKKAPQKGYDKSMPSPH